MPWSTLRETLIRRYCPPVRGDAVNWPDATLHSYWDAAHTLLKQRLCPPFAAAEFNLLNAAESHSTAGNELIARMAAYLIILDLPGRDEKTEQRRKDFLEEIIERLHSGDSTLFDSNGQPLIRANLLDCTTLATDPKFSLSTPPATGTLDQFNP